MFKKYIVCSSQCRRGKISVGENSTEQKVFTPGLNKNILLTSSTSNSVMKQFAKQGVPITYMRHFKKLAKKYKMPYELEQIPNPGDGEIYEREHYNKYLVIAVLITIILVLFALSITEYVNLIFSPNLEKLSSEAPKPMT